MKKSILIVGGGTAGWLSAAIIGAHHRNRSNDELTISLVEASDIPTVMTLTFIFAILIVLFNLIADVLYGILDPRIRYD